MQDKHSILYRLLNPFTWIVLKQIGFLFSRIFLSILKRELTCLETFEPQQYFPARKLQLAALHQRLLTKRKPVATDSNSKFSNVSYFPSVKEGVLPKVKKLRTKFSCSAAPPDMLPAKCCFTFLRCR